MALNAASSPPAEKPRIPIRSGRIFHSSARARIIRRARRVSAMAWSSTVYGEPSSRANRYRRTKAAMPCSANHSARLSPSCPRQRTRCPPPGAMMMAVPVALSGAGRNGVIEGSCTLDTLHFPGPSSTFSGSCFLFSDPGAPSGHNLMASEDSGLLAAIETSPETVTIQHESHRSV